MVLRHISARAVLRRVTQRESVRLGLLLALVLVFLVFTCPELPDGLRLWCCLNNQWVYRAVSENGEMCGREGELYV